MSEEKKEFKVVDAKEGKVLPMYRTFSDVGALKIKMVLAGYEEKEYKLVFEEEGYEPIFAPKDWVDNQSSMPGGYLVFYAGGYQSFSPADVFEGSFIKV